MPRENYLMIVCGCLISCIMLGVRESKTVTSWGTSSRTHLKAGNTHALGGKNMQCGLRKNL